MRLRTSGLLVVCLFAAVPALAFRGRVVDHNGQPVANATVSILGRTGEAITDNDGRFVWQPDPPPPFEILVIDGAGNYARPILIDSLDPSGELLVTIAPIGHETVTVSGSAPSIESTPGAATASLSSRDVMVRQPTNLVQALENVAGVNQVSEGQAAVPAIRGLARGRTLILIDGARVSSERRVGASATFMDPSLIEGVDVSRGPGSVAYGSDAFGGVISVRTRRVMPGSPWAFQFSGTVGDGGIPEQRGAVEVAKGLPEGGVLFAAHVRDADDWDSPEGAVFNSGFGDAGFLVRAEQKVGAGYLTAGWQSDFGNDIERPRNNSTTVRFYYPYEDSHRFTAGYEARRVGGLQRLAITGFLGSYAQRTDQDRFATATAGRSIERADISANDFHVRGFGEKLAGRSRIEFGVDVNGRFDLNALDDLIQYDLAGNIVGTRPNVSIDTARRVDNGVYASVEAPLGGVVVVSGGIRGDYVTTKNTGGYFGDRSTSNGAASGYASATLGSFGGVSITGQIARGFRDPVLSDRYYRGPTGRGFITGNPDLEPETSVQFDLGVRYVKESLRLATFYYQYRINDLIERYQTTIDNFFFRNRGSARVRGWEFEAQATLPAAFTVDFAAQVGDGRALDPESASSASSVAHLDDITPANVNATVRKRFGAKAFGQVRLGYFADDNEPGPTERVVPGYTLLDAAGGYQVVKPLELRVQARNLLNETYYASQDVRAVYAPGRSFSLVATVKF
jgi:outer membrane receptor protein involved in Fe transport